MYLFLLCSCKGQQAGKVVSPPQSTKSALPASVKQVSADTERLKILRYFERHKPEDKFDTSDRTYADWWGLWQSSVNSVRAGHLFSSQHIHAIVYVPVAEGKATLTVYIKDKGAWREIFSASTTDDLDLYLADWNGDGIKDLSMKHRLYSGSTDQLYDVYLADQSGLNLLKVAEFDELRSPAIDTPSGNIITENDWHGVETLGEYQIRGTAIVQLREVTVTNYWNDTCEVRTMKHGRDAGKITTKEKNVLRYLPPTFRKRSNYNPVNRDKD